MLALTFSTGIADAAGYLGLDRVFTGNMTGNVVILGMALGQADELPVVGPAVALATFMAGAAIAGRVLRRAPAGWTWRASALLVTVATLMASCAVVHLVHPVDGGSPLGVVVAGLLAAGMGIQAATARRVAVADVTTVVVTSTITAWASESRLAGGRDQPWARRSAAVGSLVVGALVGALLLEVDLSVCILFAAMIVLGAAAIGHVVHTLGSVRTRQRQDSAASS